MKDFIYIQKNKLLDIILLGITIIMITCIMPVVILMHSPIWLIGVIIFLSVAMLVLFILVIKFNSIGLGAEGVILKKHKQNEIILWNDIFNAQVKVYYGRSTIVRYELNTLSKSVVFYSDPNIINLLLKYCSNEKLTEILKEHHKKIGMEMGW